MTPGDLHDALDRLESRFRDREPSLQAFVPEDDRFERLHRDADELLARFAEPSDRGTRPALFGMPVGVKDIFHVDGFPTRAGSRLSPEELRGPEAASVTRLKEAGALVLGKTVSTEFAYFAPGLTRNPHHPERTPGGSSSGSAAAVAAGLCPLALGTQTIGSLIRPAAFCGVVGFKSSYGRISTEGVIPLAPSLDHIGTLTMDVAGATLAAQVLFPDWKIAASRRRPVLGVPESPYLARPTEEGRAHFHATCERLTAAGFEIWSMPAMPNFEEIETRHRRLVAAEAARVHEEWFRRFRGLYAPQTADLIKWGQTVSAAELEQDLAGRGKLRDELTASMNSHGIDLWLSPAALGPAPRGLATTGDPIMNLPWTYAGMPTLGLPAGLSIEGLPLGLQVTGRFGADEELLTWGAEIEKALQP